MNITHLFSFFAGTTAEEQEEAYQTTRDQLQRIASSVDAHETARARGDTDTSREKLVGLTDKIGGANWSALLQLQGALPFWARSRFKSFRKQLEEELCGLRDDASQGERPIADHWARTMSSSLGSLQDWEERALKSSRRRKLLKSAVVAIVAVAGPIFIFFQFRLGGIELERASVLFPDGPFAADTEGDPDGDADALPTVSARPADLEPYLLEFSKFYFDEPSAFASRYLSSLEAGQEPGTGGDAQESPDGDGREGAGSDGEMIHRWKVLLQNSSVRRSEFVSSVRTSVRLIEGGKFPWDQFDFDPKLSLERVDDENICLRKAGIAPAINLSWRLEMLSGEILGEGQHWMVEEPEHYVKLTSESEQWVAVKLSDHHPRAGSSDEGPFISDLYFKPPGFPAGFDGNNAERYEWYDPMKPYIVENLKGPEAYAYEKVWTLQRLEEVTRVIRGGEFKLTVTSVSIPGEEQTISLEGSLPSGFVWYQRDPLLSEEHPLKTDQGRKPAGEMAYSVGGGSGVFQTYAALASAFTPPDPDPDAVKHLTATFAVDLSGFGNVHQDTATHQFDEFLAPGGKVSLYTEATGLQTGLYHIRIEMNGVALAEFRLDTLIPEQQKFPSDRPEQWEEIKRIRTAIGRPPADGEEPQLGARSLNFHASLLNGRALMEDLSYRNEHRVPALPEPVDVPPSAP